MVTLGITGHRGLTHELSEQITAMLRAELATSAPGELTGVSCLADGADTLFAQAVLDRGGILQVLVPARKYRDGLPQEHHAAYDRLIARAVQVHELDYEDSTAESHMAASMLMLTLIDELVAIWDGSPSRGYGGTADVVEQARARDIPVRIVWPEGAIRP